MICKRMSEENSSIASRRSSYPYPLCYNRGVFMMDLRTAAELSPCLVSNVCEAVSEYFDSDLYKRHYIVKSDARLYK